MNKEIRACMCAYTHIYIIHKKGERVCVCISLFIFLPLSIHTQAHTDTFFVLQIVSVKDILS